MCTRRGGSNEYPHSMFSSRNKENNVYPCKSQFYYIKVGFKGSKLYKYVSAFFFCVFFFFFFFFSSDFAVLWSGSPSFF